MKIRLMQAGFERFTGQMGRLTFENGLSVEDVTQREFLCMSSVMQCEAEDGTRMSPVDTLLAIANVGAPMLDTVQASELERNAAALKAADAQQNVYQPQAKLQAQNVPPASTYTEQELAEIADREGIRGLRAIAEPMGIKGNSIKDLITAILKGPKVEA